QVFFEDELQPVRERLQKSEGADTRGSPAILHAAHNLTLQPHRIRHSRQQHEDRNQDLHHRGQKKCKCAIHRFLRATRLPSCSATQQRTDYRLRVTRFDSQSKLSIQQLATTLAAQLSSRVAEQLMFSPPSLPNRWVPSRHGSRLPSSTCSRSVPMFRR